jgi:protease-4
VKPAQKLGLAVLAGLLVFASLSALRQEMLSRGLKLDKSMDFSPARVAVLPLNGEITDGAETIHWLRQFGENTGGVKAIVIALNTPGGAVAPSQEICQEIERLRKDDGIKVVAAMGSMAASGGYYIASSCDEIVADPGTVTGSIGVIMETFEGQALLDKLGVKSEVVKSAEFKDAGSPFRAMSARDRAVFQGTVNDVYDQFVGDVASGRRGALAAAMARRTGLKAASFTDKEIKAYVKSLADGRIYTGRQAYRLGLVDSLGGLEDAIAKAQDLAGLKSADVVTIREPRSFAETMTGMDRAGWSAFLRETLLGSAWSGPHLSYLLR